LEFDRSANRRVKELGLTHIRFDAVDISCPREGPFDAVVGRLVLMYQPDPEAVLAPSPTVSRRAA
jgi:hypothetical protein